MWLVYKVHNFIYLLVMRELVRIQDNSLPIYKKLCQLSQKIFQISTRYLKAALPSWSKTIILRKNWANFKFYKSKLKFNKTPNSHIQCFYMWFTYAENTVQNLHRELFFWLRSNLYFHVQKNACSLVLKYATFKVFMIKFNILYFVTFNLSQSDHILKVQ